jgi:DNA polymerase III epsilon subunit family exonuclease
VRDVTQQYINACSNSERRSNNIYTVIDFETTGIDVHSSEVIEYAAVRVIGNELCDSISSLCKPRYAIPAGATRVNGITDKMVCGKSHFTEHLDSLLEYVGDSIVVAHNAAFDIGFLNKYCMMLNKPLVSRYSCTMRMARSAIHEDIANYRLQTVAGYFRINNNEYHRALGDAMTAAGIMIELINLNSKIDIQPHRAGMNNYHL